MDEMTNQASTLDSLRDTAEQLRILNAQLPEFVIDARFHGASWAQVGDALGMTRQAAHERFGKLTA